MSKRQPTIIISDLIIAHDEIAAIIDLDELSPSAKNWNESASKAGRLVNGTSLPLPPQDIDRLIDFLHRNEL
jgi:hypothetical protein